MTSEGIEMARFASIVDAQFARRPVLDRTGLTGQFALALEFAVGAELVNALAVDAPSIFTALETARAKLRASANPDVVVVDRAEKPSFD